MLVLNHEQYINASETFFFDIELSSCYLLQAAYCWQRGPYHFYNMDSSVGLQDSSEAHLT